MLTSWMLAVSVFSRQSADAMASRVLGILALVGAPAAIDLGPAKKANDEKIV